MKDEKQYFDKLNDQIDKILKSRASKKLIVSGPGTGKTSFFEKTIRHYGGVKNEYLVLTFINNLEDELQRDLGELAKVYTFHGYCHYLLRKYPNLRQGLREDFEYYPPLIKLVKSDWKIAYQEGAPLFSNLMRSASVESSLKFFLTRGNYYNTVGYDDSVYRVLQSFNEKGPFSDNYKLIIVDEYQDFNKLETLILSFLANYSPTLIVGDDDQALYCQLRNSSPDYIRNLFNAGEYEFFELPFCLRCPDAVIQAFKELVLSAKKNNLLDKRINKNFDFFPPIKGEDSSNYPYIKLVTSSIQRKTPVGANYFGRYIVQEIKKIPLKEAKESHTKDFPTVLIIGPTYYLTSIIPALEAEKFDFDFKKSTSELEIDIDKGLSMLKNKNQSNLGWRVVMEIDEPNKHQDIIKKSIVSNVGLFDLLPKSYIQRYLRKAEAFEYIPKESPEVTEKIIEEPSIKLVTYEGAKGLSAQHVFILGLQNGDLPRVPTDIKDLELCKFLVALTRTRKQCHILCAYNFAGKRVTPSIFVDWLPIGYVEKINVNKDYWVN